MSICAVAGCGNSHYRLEKWRSEYCQRHQCKFDTGKCVCPPPFVFFQFPAETRDPQARKEWCRLVNRKDPKTGKNWVPKKHSRICSKHFPDGKPTKINPYPILELGYRACYQNLKHGRREIMRSPLPSTCNWKTHKPSSVDQNHEISVDCPSVSTSHTNMDTTYFDTYVENDHAYLYSCPCSENCNCRGCLQKQQEIMQLRAKIAKLEEEQCVLRKKVKNKNSVLAEKIIKKDKHARDFLGVSSISGFQFLAQHVATKAGRLRYWRGQKQFGIVSSKVKRKFQGKPKKFGPKRKLSIVQELLLVLMKLRMDLTNEFLAALFDVCPSTCSSILNTWLKFLAEELKPLIYIPSKEAVKRHLPECYQSFVPNIRYILDCTEVFIERPRDLELQAQTWSDYKHHNTLKMLVVISPNGHICMLSDSYGGRASDRQITHESGFLNYVDPTDQVMADRGFTIKEDLLMRGAELYIPPAARGTEQFDKCSAKKTKQVANLRIHVERAINRIKNFHILKNVLPISLVPLADEINVVTAALCNLQNPLVRK